MNHRWSARERLFNRSVPQLQHCHEQAKFNNQNKYHKLNLARKDKITFLKIKKVQKEAQAQITHLQTLQRQEEQKSELSHMK